MILQPAVIVLMLVCLLNVGMLLYASSQGIRIMRRWDITSGSEEQLRLERKTYLISMVVAFMLTLEIVSFFLYIFTADRLHPLFTGAMCAAGTLHANPYGYPALLLKVLSTVLCGVWLIVNFIDNRAYDYPLVRTKYVMLLAIAPSIVAGSLLETAYFTHLKGFVITSCCGSLFGETGATVASDLAAMPAGLAVPAFFLGMGSTFGLGVTYLIKEKLGVLFSAVAGAFFVVSVVSLVSFICPYFYELPNHHCPFCILQQAYGYVGYPLYALLLTGVVSGLGVGGLMPFRRIGSLSKSLPVTQRRLTVLCLAAYLIFAAISVWQMVFSHLSMGMAHQVFRWPR